MGVRKTIAMIKKLRISLMGTLLLCLLLATGGCFMYSNPPLPEIKYGEFPFRLEYEINGQRVVVEDTIVCEFDGIGWNGTMGEKYRKWKTYLASGREQPGTYSTAVLIDERNEIYFSLGGGSKILHG